MYELLRTLDYSHSKGIMHRDLKMSNILVDVDSRQIWLIDWGLSRFYTPFRELDTGMGTPKFRGPELILDITEYHYSVDVWSLGCIFGALIFDQSPFFARGIEKPSDT